MISGLGRRDKSLIASFISFAEVGMLDFSNVSLALSNAISKSASPRTSICQSDNFQPILMKSEIEQVLLDAQWYQVYDAIELFVEALYNDQYPFY